MPTVPATDLIRFVRIKKRSPNNKYPMRVLSKAKQMEQEERHDNPCVKPQHTTLRRMIDNGLFAGIQLKKNRSCPLHEIIIKKKAEERTEFTLEEETQELTIRMAEATCLAEEAELEEIISSKEWAKLLNQDALVARVKAKEAVAGVSFSEPAVIVEKSIAAEEAEVEAEEADFAAAEAMRDAEEEALLSKANFAFETTRAYLSSSEPELAAQEKPIRAIGGSRFSLERDESLRSLCTIETELGVASGEEAQFSKMAAELEATEVEFATNTELAAKEKAELDAFEAVFTAFMRTVEAKQEDTRLTKEEEGLEAAEAELAAAEAEFVVQEKYRRKLEKILGSERSLNSLDTTASKNSIFSLTKGNRSQRSLGSDRSLGSFDTHAKESRRKLERILGSERSLNTFDTPMSKDSKRSLLKRNGSQKSLVSDLSLDTEEEGSRRRLHKSLGGDCSLNTFDVMTNKNSKRSPAKRSGSQRSLGSGRSLDTKTKESRRKLERILGSERSLNTFDTMASKDSKRSLTKRNGSQRSLVSDRSLDTFETMTSKNTKRSEAKRNGSQGSLVSDLSYLSWDTIFTKKSNEKVRNGQKSGATPGQGSRDSSQKSLGSSLGNSSWLIQSVTKRKENMDSKQDQQDKSQKTLESSSSSLEIPMMREWDKPSEKNGRVSKASRRRVPRKIFTALVGGRNKQTSPPPPLNGPSCQSNQVGLSLSQSGRSPSSERTGGGRIHRDNNPKGVASDLNPNPTRSQRKPRARPVRKGSGRRASLRVDMTGKVGLPGGEDELNQCGSSNSSLPAASSDRRESTERRRNQRRNNGGGRRASLNSALTVGSRKRATLQKSPRRRSLDLALVETSVGEAEAMVQEAVQMMQAINRRHLEDFIRLNPSASYEEWIGALHPENVHDKNSGVIDHRFYVRDSDHRLLWNELLDGDRNYVDARSRFNTLARR